MKNIPVIRILIYLLFLVMLQQNLSEARDNMFMPFGIMTTGDNCSIRYGVWLCDKSPRSGSVILLNGRTEFMEKYAETISELNHRGFDVYSFDWRGQGLSSRILKNRHKGFIETYENYLDDLTMFVDKIVSPQAASPLIVLAHSMGGHIALRYLHDHPGVIERAVLVSPMIDILNSLLSRWFARSLVYIADKAGWNNAYVIGSGDYSPDAVRFEGNRLTSDSKRFSDTKNAIKENPDLALGGVTYGWLSATFKSIDILAQPGYVEEITTPIQLISAGSDQVVSIEAQETICSLLKKCRLTVIPKARHEILMETDSLRSIFWKEFDNFVNGDKQ